MQPVHFYKRLELAGFTVIHFMVALQPGFYAKSGLNIAITVAMNEGSVAFAVLIGFDSHPGNLCLRLNIPFITRSLAAIKFS